MLDLFQEVVVVELVLGQFLLEATGFFLVELFLGAFHKRDDVAHTEDTVGHTFGVEHVEGIHLLADTDELDGLVNHGADGEGGTATSVAIEFGEHHAVEVETIVEGLGRVDGVLTRHGVHHEEGFMRMHRRFDAGNLVHHLLIDGQTAGGIDDDHALVLRLGVLDGMLGDLDRVFVALFAIHLHLDLLTEGLQLLDGGGTIHVTGDEQHLLAALAFQIIGQLG